MQSSLNEVREDILPFIFDTEWFMRDSWFPKHQRNSLGILINTNQHHSHKIHEIAVAFTYEMRNKATISKSRTFLIFF